MRIRIEEEHKNSTFAITSLVEDYVLQGQGSQVISKTTFPRYKPFRGYLIVIVSSNNKVSDIIKWKVALNNIALTREFRPHIDAKINEKLYQAIFVYEVSKILSSNGLTFKISYEGKERIKIDGAVLITLHQYDDDNTYLLCNSEIIPLIDYYEMELPTQKYKDYRTAYIHMGIIAQKPSQLHFIVDSNQNKLFPLGEGFNFIETNIHDVSSLTKIKLKCDNEMTRHVFNCVVFSSALQPDIILNHYELNENNLKLQVRNVGASRADAVEVLIIRSGWVMQRLSLGTMNSNEEKSINIVLPKDIARKVMVRILWRKVLRTFVRDYQITL